LEAWLPVYFKERDAADDTAKQYRWTIREFRKFLGREPQLGDLTQKQILQFALDRMETGTSESTADRQRASLVALRRFMDEMRGRAMGTPTREQGMDDDMS
jgi:site-specific recombinase XerD